jgi:hypothetical protein
MLRVRSTQKGTAKAVPCGMEEYCSLIPGYMLNKMRGWFNAFTLEPLTENRLNLYTF